MMKTNYIKVFRDWRTYTGRTICALAGMLIGIFSIGVILTAYSILVREMDVNYWNTNPASMVMTVENLDERAVELVQSQYPAMEMELRKTLTARIANPDGTFEPITLFVVQDLHHPSVDTFSLYSGAFPYESSQMMLERDSLNNLPGIVHSQEEAIEIRLPGYPQRTMKLCGTVHAPGLPPASMEKISYGFLTLDEIAQFGCDEWYDEMHIVFHENRLEREILQGMAFDIGRLLAQNGYRVTDVQVPVPGRHPHGDQLASLLFLLQSFTAISLFVASLVIVNLVSFILTTQARQIAVMRATGARNRDIRSPYLSYVVVLGLVAAIPGIPAATVVGMTYAGFAADRLNFVITSYQIPVWVFAVQVFAGVLVPMAACILPVNRGCRLTIREGLAGQSIRKGKSEAGMHRAHRSKPMLLLSVGNLFRSKTRTMLAILALSTGGVLFMSAMNITASIDKMTQTGTEVFRYNWDIQLHGQYPDEQVLAALKDIHGIDDVMIYKTGMTTLARDSKGQTASTMIKAFPENSPMVNLMIPRGTVIINRSLLESEPWLGGKDVIHLMQDGGGSDFEIIGVISEVPPIPCIYMNILDFEGFAMPCSQNILIRTDLPQAAQSRIERQIESSLASSTIEVVSNQNTLLLRQAFLEHLKIILKFLTAVTMLAVVVGGFSISSCIGMNVFERRREIGILRATGAGPSQTILLVVAESLLMGLVGWLVGVVLSYPVSVYAGNYFGQIFFRSDLNNALSISGMLSWGGISMLVTLISGLVPAFSATASPLREMLDYE